MPAITLRCRNRHEFITRAKPGGVTGCPECRRLGQRVSVRVPKRALEHRGGEAAQAAGGGEAARLSGAWAAEAPAVWEWRKQTSGESGHQCRHCGGPLYWAGAHTALLCPDCPAWDVSPAAKDRAGEHSAALERRAARTSGELAVRDQAAAAEARAARAHLRGRKEILERGVRRKLETVANTEAHDGQQHQRQALEAGAWLRGYLPEIAAAEDEATLNDIAGELAEVLESDSWRELEAAAERTAERREQQQRAAELAEEYARQQAELERQQQAEAARAARAAERQAEAAAERKRQQQAIRSDPYTLAGVGLAQLIQMQQAKTRAREQALAGKGACGFKHRNPEPASRLYAIAARHWNGAVQPANGAPQVRACRKHWADADAWINSQGYAEALYWEL